MCGVDEYDKAAMANFIAQYGPEKGKEVYYATANKQDRSPETFEKNENLEMSGDDPYDPISAAHAEYQSPFDRMYDSDDWVRAQQDAIGTDDEELSPEMSAIDDMMFEKKVLVKKPVEPKLSIEKAINEMDEIIESIVTPRKKKVYTLK